MTADREHPSEADYAPEACDGCAGSYGPCYTSQVLRREAEAAEAAQAEGGNR